MSFAQRAFNEAKADLIRELGSLIGNVDEMAKIVERWADNHFETFHTRAVIDNLMMKEANDSSLKAHMIRKQCIDMAVEVATKAGFGEEEIQMGWDKRVSYRNKDYRPSWQTSEIGPFKELRLSFVVMRRMPVSWYSDETVDSWVERLKK